MESRLKTQIIAVVGASGSGKSTVVAQLIADSELPISVVQVDHYYRELSHLTLDERDRVNFDHPDAIEFERLCEDLKTLRRGESIRAPIYDFTVHNRSRDTQRVEATDFVIVEGILALADSAAAALVDKVVFIDTSLAICLARRIARDVSDRGRSEESVRDFWETRAAPMFSEYVAPWKAKADLVVSGEDDPSVTHNQLTSWLRK